MRLNLSSSLLFMALVFLQGVGVSAREWTSTDGQTIEAEFVSASDEAVTILKEGKSFTIKLNKLSPSDRAFVNIKKAAAKLPKPPFTLEPIVPDSKHEGETLSEFSAYSLGVASREFAGERDYENAAKFAYWAVLGGQDLSYNLACYSARAGQVGNGFYWLQQAALTEGADAAWAQKDRDLKILRDDPRWEKVHAFLVQVGKQWNASGLMVTNLIVPKDYNPKTPIPVVTWLHGFGADPDLGSYQKWANELEVAFLGASGTIPHGPKSFAWAEDLKLDQARIDAALKEVQAKLTPKSGKIVLFGFSQGAALSAELSAEHPDRYAGAIVLSPGSTKDGWLPKKAKPELTGSRYVIAYGGGEHRLTIARGKFYAEGLDRLGAKVNHKPYPELARHTFPPDFREAFPKWVAEILNSEK